MMFLRTCFFLGMLTCSSVAPCAEISVTATCATLRKNYADLQVTHPELPDLTDYNDAIDDYAHGTFFNNVKDSVGSLRCNSDGTIQQLELDFNGSTIESDVERQIALVRYRHVAIALIVATGAGNWSWADELLKRVSASAADKALSGVVRGDDDPRGETSEPIGQAFTFTAIVDSQGPAFVIERH